MIEAVSWRRWKKARHLVPKITPRRTRQEITPVKVDKIDLWLERFSTWIESFAPAFFAFLEWMTIVGAIGYAARKVELIYLDILFLLGINVLVVWSFVKALQILGFTLDSALVTWVWRLPTLGRKIAAFVLGLVFITVWVQLVFSLVGIIPMVIQQLIAAANL